ncbi:MAG: WG repeat-containing protein [Phaeodactylibacter sp.]|uniref:WG repeat-containing protein n=1 Tax=Phaeodactylibacter sp. TaxID=1940289 RepID=UPI0032EF4A6B
MRLFFILISILLFGGTLPGQRYFPIKKDNKWGLIDASGTLVQAPVYDAIGEFKQFGYAVMQFEGKVGLLGANGQRILQPKYEDIKVLDSTLIAVMDEEAWMVVNLFGKVVLEKGYERVHVVRQHFLTYQKEGKWGLTNQFGHRLAPAVYDEIKAFDNNCFLTRKGQNLGLLSGTGRVIIDNRAEDIQVYQDSLFFFREDYHWGAVDFYGIERIPAVFKGYSKIDNGYIKLSSEKGNKVFSLYCNRIITPDWHHDYYSFSPRYLIVKESRRLGLINWCGQEVFPPVYNEIQPYTRDHFRVNKDGQWGVADKAGTLLIPLAYDYIAPLRGKVCVVKKENQFGLVHIDGTEIVAPEYDRIVLEKQEAKAYTRTPDGPEKLTLLTLDAEGRLRDANKLEQHFQVKIGSKEVNKSPTRELGANAQNSQLLEQFEWFYAPEEDRWGLRRLNDGGVQIEPMFSFVQVEHALGLTLVGIPQSHTNGFDRTHFRFDRTYGIVNNALGLLVTELEFLDIRLSDFRQGGQLARCVFSNGRHGLIDSTGRVARRDLAFIGLFVNGVARFSFSGQLSGSVEAELHLGSINQYLRSLAAPSIMQDYTQYDIKFKADANLICEGCEWGYLDQTGAVVVPPQYTFAKDFVNDVGIVACHDKWGMVNQKAKVILPCQYDGVHFMENTDNQMVRVYIQEPKYGLVDTLGQITVSAVYDELGYFSEGRLAVRRNGLWGFVNTDGMEVIPCRFREVQNFSQGLAAVRLGSGWGFIDKQGRIIIDLQYRRVGSFSDGLAWVATDEGVGYINEAGHKAIPPNFDRAYDFQQGTARVVVDQDYGLIDVAGDYIQRPKYNHIGPFDANGLAIAQDGGHSVHYALIDRRGTAVTNQKFKAITPFEEGLAVVKTKNGYGYIDVRGNLVIEDRFSKASSFSEGFAAVQLDGQCGYIDLSGQVVVPCNYSKCLDFEGGRAVVYKGMRRAGLIDQSGNLLIEPSLDRLLNFQEGRGLVRDEQYRFYYITEQASPYNGYYEQATEFKYGVAVVQINGKWGIINQKGIEIIPPRYDKIESFRDGYARVRIQGFNGLASLEGELLVQPDYEYISYAGEGLYRVEKGDKIGYFDQSGQWVWALNR